MGGAGVGGRQVISHHLVTIAALEGVGVVVTLLPCCSGKHLFAPSSELFEGHCRARLFLSFWTEKVIRFVEEFLKCE